MSVVDDPPLHDFADRAMRKLLAHPEQLAEFLRLAVPDLADRFDCERARLLDREFPLPDWRRREADLFFEVPYRDEAGEVPALVAVLIEHQTADDPLTPLRTLIYSALYWDRVWKNWADAAQRAGPLRLPPVLPLVLHTGGRPWRAAREFAELFDGPAALLPFVPTWRPIYWELADHSADELLDAESALAQVLAVVRAGGRAGRGVRAGLYGGDGTLADIAGSPTREMV